MPRFRGIMSPMTMPFDEAGELVLDAIKPQIEYLLESGERLSEQRKQAIDDVLDQLQRVQR